MNLIWPVTVVNFTPNVGFCRIDSIGGVVDNSAVRMAIVTELPEWTIIYPITCPHYTQYYSVNHQAIDLVNLGCNNDNGVFAVGAGKVIFADWSGGYGYRIEILHGNGLTTSYSHLFKISVELNQEVVLGQQIGILGSTGRSTGTHVHFEIIYQGIKIDPDIYLGK